MTVVRGRSLLFVRSDLCFLAKNFDDALRLSRRPPLKRERETRGTTRFLQDEARTSWICHAGTFSRHQLKAGAPSEEIASDDSALRWGMCHHFSLLRGRPDLTLNASRALDDLTDAVRPRPRPMVDQYGEGVECHILALGPAIHAIVNGVDAWSVER